MSVIRASELGGCVKAQIARHMGYEPLPTPEKMQAIFDRGNEHEELCVDAMRAAGYTITHQQHETIIVWGANQIVGHLDGVVTIDDSHPSVLEIKSPGAWQKFQTAHRTGDWSDPLAHRYAWQISVYMLAMGMEATIACLTDDGDLRTFGIETPPFDEQAVYARIDTIINGAVNRLLPKDCTQNDYPCPVAYLHEAPDVEDDTILDELVFRYEQAAADEKLAKGRKDDLKADIEAHMAGRLKVETASVKVTVYEQAGPARWNEEKMLADGIDPSDYRTVGKPSRRIKITGKGT